MLGDRTRVVLCCYDDVHRCFFISITLVIDGVCDYWPSIIIDHYRSISTNQD